MIKSQQNVSTKGFQRNKATGMFRKTASTGGAGALRTRTRAPAVGPAAALGAAPLPCSPPVQLPPPAFLALSSVPGVAAGQAFLLLQQVLLQLSLTHTRTGARRVPLSPGSAAAGSDACTGRLGSPQCGLGQRPSRGASGPLAPPRPPGPPQAVTALTQAESGLPSSSTAAQSVHTAAPREATFPSRPHQTENMVFFMVLQLRRTKCRKFQDDLDNCPFQDSPESSKVSRAPACRPPGCRCHVAWGGGQGQKPAAGDLPGRRRARCRGRATSALAPATPRTRSPQTPVAPGPEPGEEQGLSPCGPHACHALPTGEEPGGVQADLCLDVPISGPSLAPEPVVQAKVSLDLPQARPWAC